MTNKEDPKTTQSSDSDELLDDELAKVAGGVGVVVSVESPPDPCVGDPTAVGKVKIHDIPIVKSIDKPSPSL